MRRYEKPEMIKLPRLAGLTRLAVWFSGGFINYVTTRAYKAYHNEVKPVFGWHR